MPANSRWDLIRRLKGYYHKVVICWVDCSKNNGIIKFLVNQEAVITNTKEGSTSQSFSRAQRLLLQ